MVIPEDHYPTLVLRREPDGSSQGGCWVVKSASSGTHCPRSVSDLEACSDQRERAIEMTLTAGPRLVY